MEGDARAGTTARSAANSTRPTVTMAQNAVSASAATVVEAPKLAGHVELRPVAVHRLADAVEDGEAGVQPEPRRDRRAAPALRRARRAACTRSGSRRLTRSSPTSRTVDSHGQPPPEARGRRRARRTTGASAVPSPSSALSTSTDRSTASRVEGGGEECSARDGEAEPGAEEGRRDEQEQEYATVGVVGERACWPPAEHHRDQAAARPAR